MCVCGSDGKSWTSPVASLFGEQLPKGMLGGIGQVFSPNESLFVRQPSGEATAGEEKRSGFFVRGGAWPEEEEEASLLSIKHWLRCHKIRLDSCQLTPEQRKGCVGDREAWAEQQVGEEASCCTHTAHHHQLLLPAAGD